MQLDLKPYFITLASVIALLILFGIARNLLFEKQITAWQSRNDGLMKAIVVTAFVVMAAAAVPIILQFFVRTQIRIGNGDLPLVAKLRTQPMHVIYSVWTIFGIGLAIAIPAIIKYDSIPSTSS